MLCNMGLASIPAGWEQSSKIFEGERAFIGKTYLGGYS
jgi:hypothetical protein